MCLVLGIDLEIVYGALTQRCVQNIWIVALVMCI